MSIFSALPIELITLPNYVGLEPTTSRLTGEVTHLSVPLIVDNWT